MNGYETEELQKSYIAALLKDLPAYEANGDEEAVKAIRAELRAFGWQAEKPQERAEKRGPGRPRKDA